eukprot:UN03244
MFDIWMTRYIVLHYVLLRVKHQCNIPVKCLSYIFICLVKIVCINIPNVDYDKIPSNKSISIIKSPRDIDQ